MEAIERLAVRYVPTSELIPYAGNAKEHPKHQIKEIVASIRDFGFDDPIAVWHNAAGDMEIVEGHGRLLAAQDMGLTTVPVITLDHLTDAERRAYVHVHNQTTLTSGFDEEKLMEDIQALDQFDWREYGFEEYVGKHEDDDVEFTDEEPPALVETRCKEGDRWALGEHVLVCGDSTSQETWEKLMDGETADLMVTDPPYNVEYVGKTKDALTIENDALGDGEFTELLDGFMARAMERMKPGAAYYIWHASRTQREFEDAINKAGSEVRQQIIWNKSVFCLSRQDYQWKHEPCFYGWKDGAAHHFVDKRTLTTTWGEQPDPDKMSKDELRDFAKAVLKNTTVWDFDKPSRSELHPTMKPIPLMGRCILNSSKRGDLVIDPFGGSGSTLIACEESGRRCRTIELDPHYCDVIIQRWENETGRKAVRA